MQRWEFTALRPLLEDLAFNTAVSIQIKEPKPRRNVAIIKLTRKSGTGPLSAEDKVSGSLTRKSGTGPLTAEDKVSGSLTRKSGTGPLSAEDKVSGSEP